MAPAAVCGAPQSAVNNSWLWLLISRRALVAGCRARAGPAGDGGRPSDGRGAFPLGPTTAAFPATAAAAEAEPRERCGAWLWVFSASRTWSPFSQPWGSLLAAAGDTQSVLGPWDSCPAPRPLQPLELVVSQSDQPRLFGQGVFSECGVPSPLGQQPTPAQLHSAASPSWEMFAEPWAGLQVMPGLECWAGLHSW